jgi:hypothetical protein
VEPTVEEVEPTVGEAAQPTVEEVEPTVEEVEPTVEEVEPPVEEVEPTAEEHVPGTSVPGTSGVALGPAVARYSLDPLGDPEPRRRFSRGRTPAATVEVPARPEGRRPLPRRRDDA